MPDEGTTSSSTAPEETSTRSEQLTFAVRQALGPYLDQQIEAFERVDRLVHVAEWLSESEDHQNESQDILRAAVVLTHAQLEEFLRTMARVLLPEAQETCLNEIPLAGLGGRKEKFFLGKLVQHKGKLVDDLLKESVSEYLERSNYNSIEEISNLLQVLGFNVRDHTTEFPAIQRMIERRHQIVHRADRSEAPHSVGPLQPIKFDDVSRWLHATQEFMKSLYFPLLPRLIPIEFKPAGDKTVPK